MTKKTLHSIATLISFFAVSCYADPISFQPPPSTTNNAAASQLQPVLSPEDFKKKVQSKGQKTQDDLTQQANKLLPAKKPPQAVIPGASTGAPASTGTNTPPPPLPQNEAAPNAAPPKEIPPLPDAAAQQPSEVAAPAPLQQNQSYTGFIGTTPDTAPAGASGAGTPDGKGSTPENKPWKIQY